MESPIFHMGRSPMGGREQQKILSRYTPAEQQEIERKRKVLSAIAYFIGKDFEMPVELNAPGKGWHLDLENNVIRIDPSDLLQKPEDFLRFVIAHEGAHRRITRVSEAEKKMWEEEAGFSLLGNHMEDGRINNFLIETYPRIAEQVKTAYDVRFKEIEEKSKERARAHGLMPKHLLAALEYSKQWFRNQQGRPFDIPSTLPEDVQEVVRNTLNDAEDAWLRFPSKQEADSGEQMIRVYAEASYQVISEKIWPQFKKLVEASKKDARTEEALKDMLRGASPGSSGEAGNQPPPEKRDPESSQKPKIPEELSQQLSKVERIELEEILEKSAGGTAVPLESLSEGLKEKIEQYIESLVTEALAELERRAEALLKEIDDYVSKQLQNKFEQEQVFKEGRTPSTAGTPRAVEPAELAPIRQSAKEALEAKNEYERYRDEVLPLIDKLEDELRTIFVERRAHGWETGYRSGKRMDISRRMQEKAKKVGPMESRAWQRREMPTEKDYAISLLVDLSGSMIFDNKIIKTFKGAIVLSEVLNRLSINNEIFGFNERVKGFKLFHERFSNDIRVHMGSMPEEVAGPYGGYTDIGYAVRESVSRLKKESESEKFLIVVTDGGPSPIYGHNSPEYDLTNVMRSITEEGEIKVIGLGLGRGTEFVKDYFPNNMANVSVSEMTERLGALLKDIIEYPDNF